MSSQSIDTNVNNYSIEELIELLNIEEVDVTEQSVKKSIQNILNEYNIDTNSPLQNFFLDVEIKILEYLDTQEQAQTTVENAYNVTNEQLTISRINTTTMNPIIEKETVKYNDVFNDVNPDGIINPIRRRNIIQQVNIDSLFRENYTSTQSTDFQYKLPFSINNVVSMRVSSIEIPNIWNTFSDTQQNNEFTIQISNAYTYPDQTFIIKIPEGSYTSTEFITIMNNYFNNVGSGNALSFLYLDIDEYTGSTIIRAKNENDPGVTPLTPIPYDPTNTYYSPNFEFMLDFRLSNNTSRNLQQNCGWILGFRSFLYKVDQTNQLIDNITDATQTITYKGYLKSEGTFNLSNHNYIFLEVDDFNNNYKNSIISSKNNTMLGNNILARITVTTDKFTLLMDNGYNKIFKQRDFFGPVRIERLHIRLIDKLGNVIDLNNNDFSFAIEFTQIYS